MTNPYAPPQSAVRDVTDPRDTTVPAERITRLGAAILDSIIIGVMVYMPFGVGVAMGAAVSVNMQSASTDLGTVPLALGLGLGCIGLMAWIAVTISNIRRNGQTLAKRMLDIKIVRADGSPASVGRAFWLRYVVNTLLGLIPLYGIIDVLFIFSESRQCLHDRLADTIVIRA